MNIALLDIRMNAQNPYISSMVSARNMVILSNYLNADLIWDKRKIPNKKYDCIICGFGSQFSEYNKSSQLIKDNPNSRIFWLIGEYEQSMFPAIHYGVIKENKKLEIIQNFVDVSKKQKYVSKIHELNFNLLISNQSNELTPKKYDCIYYGRWRENRKQYFQKYIKEQIYLSTSDKNFKKYKHIGCNPKWIKKLSWAKSKETLNLFRYSLYIEDEYTHTVFNNLGNRWYEAGFCNCVVFFDINCWNTILKSEIGYFKDQIEDYIVTDYEGLQEKIKYCNKDFEKHLVIQKSWRLKEPFLKEEMLKEFKNIIYS